MKKIPLIIMFTVIISSILIGCQIKTPQPDNSQNDVDLNVIFKAIKEHLGDNYVPNIDLDENQLKEMTNLDTNLLDDYIAQIPMINIHIDTYISIKAKANKGDIVEKKLIDYKNDLIENSFQYPMNKAKVNTSKVVRHGDYVFFIMLGSFDERQDVTEMQQIKFAEAEVLKIKKIINTFFK